MGDMADYHLDSEDEWWFPPERKQVPAARKCKYCGMIGLVWKRKDDQWRLYEAGGKLHECWNNFKMYER
jgi:hypothetical protein